MHNDLITTTIKDLVRNMGLDCESVEAVTESETHPRFLLKSKDSAVLIGNRGEHLSALNVVARRIVAKKLPSEEQIKFYIDVNNYLETAIKELEMKAKIMAERVRSFKTNIELDPMTSFERMIVHAALQNMADIKTESTGVGKSRRVVIKPAESEAL